MKSSDKNFSRRKFLKHGSAALAAGYALDEFLPRALGKEVRVAKGAAGGRQGIACVRQEAAEAARDVLKDGGNAIDAAVAAILVLFVIEPSNTGLGGYGGCLAIYDAKSGRARAIDCTSRAPRKIDISKLDAKTINHGCLAVGVPGNVAGVDLALSEFGTQPFGKLATHAIAMAADGIKVTPALSAQFDGLLKSIDPVSLKAYFPKGVPATGETWVQSDLARLMRRLCDEGPGSFYTGETAATICKQVQAGGGALAEDDFHEFQATSSDPLHIRYRGYDLYTPSLPAGGITSLSTLKTLEQFDLAKYEPWGPDYYDLFVNAAHLAWIDREKYFGDPEFVKVPFEMLLSAEHAKANASMIRTGKALPRTKSDDSSHTVNLVVVDEDQNVVSWTATHGNDFGSHVAIDGLGLMLGHGISRFDLDKASPNYPRPRKRPQHNMAPMIVMKDGKPRAGLGMPGGPRIVNVTTQMAVNLIDFKAPTERVVSAPRIHTEGHDPIQVSSGTPPAVIELLKKKGHAVQTSAVGGAANAIAIDFKTGAVQGAASGPSTGLLVF